MKPLTPRCREILGYLFMGKTNAEIAAVLGLSALTVKNHVHEIVRTIGGYNRQNAVWLALRAGILQPPAVVIPEAPPPPPPPPPPVPVDLVVIGNLSVAPSLRLAAVNGIPLDVPRGAAARLLYVLAHHPGMLFTRQQLFEQTHGERSRDIDPMAVHILVCRLRKAMREAGCDHTIETERGVGFRLVPVSQFRCP